MNAKKFIAAIEVAVARLDEKESEGMSVRSVNFDTDCTNYYAIQRAVNTIAHTVFLEFKEHSDFTKWHTRLLELPKLSKTYYSRYPYLKQGAA